MKRQQFLSTNIICTLYVVYEKYVVLESGRSCVSCALRQSVGEVELGAHVGA